MYNIGLGLVLTTTLLGGSVSNFFYYTWNTWNMSPRPCTGINTDPLDLIKTVHTFVFLHEFLLPLLCICLIITIIINIAILTRQKHGNHRIHHLFAPRTVCKNALRLQARHNCPPLMVWGQSFSSSHSSPPVGPPRPHITHLTSRTSRMDNPLHLEALRPGVH